MGGRWQFGRSVVYMNDSVEQGPDENERESVLLSWIHGFEKSVLEKLSGVRLEIVEIEEEGGEEGREDEENEAEPVLEAKYPCDCTREAGGDELDVVNGVVVEQDMRSEEPLLLVVWGGG